MREPEGSPNESKSENQRAAPQPAPAHRGPTHARAGAGHPKPHGVLARLPRRVARLAPRQARASLPCRHVRSACVRTLCMYAGLPPVEAAGDAAIRQRTQRYAKLCCRHSGGLASGTSARCSALLSASLPHDGLDGPLTIRRSLPGLLDLGALATMRKYPGSGLLRDYPGSGLPALGTVPKTILLGQEAAVPFLSRFSTPARAEVFGTAPRRLDPHVAAAN